MRRFLAIFLPLLAVLGIAIWRSRGPAPAPSLIAPADFSAARAKVALAELLGDGRPHPVGTRANVIVRQRLVKRFEALGYDTFVQRRFACNAHATCAVVENVIARIPGAPTRETVLLVSHYDSVAAGPGASDDAMGTAALLEIARAIRAEKTRNPIAFLVTDGEEAGLLGAEGFVADEALCKDVAVIVNVENRGTYGVSNMFETSRHNRWLIRHLARGVPRPHATSFFYAIYELLPNDTDVTVFKRAGIAAINFAAIGGVRWYHTPFDDLAHASERTLQHHGENLLGTARALADADLAARTNDDASYFDLLGFALVWWPAKTTIWVAVLSLLLLAFAARKSVARQITFGVLATFAAIVLAILGGIGVSWLARLKSEGASWVAEPLPSIAAMWLIGIAAALCAAALFRRWSEEKPMLYGAAIVWHAIAIALALTLTGASFVFLVPAIAVSICALARAGETLTAAAASTAAAIVIFPMGLLLYEALGSGRMVALAILLGMLATLFAPLFARFRNAAIVAVLALICAGIAMMRPAYTAERPRHLSLSYVDDPAAPSPLWLTSSAPPATLARAAQFQPLQLALLPWNRATQYATPADPIRIPRVSLDVVRNGSRLTIRVTSGRSARRLSIAYRGGKLVDVNGIAPPPPPARFRGGDVNGWRFASATAAGELNVELESSEPVEIIASDISDGIPAIGAALAARRNAAPAVPVGAGDVTITRARGRF